MCSQRSASWIDEIKQRADQAAQGPWHVLGDDDAYFIVDATGDIVHGRENAEFIAHALEDVTNLIEEVERSRVTLQAVRQWAENAEEWARVVNNGERLPHGKDDMKTGFFLSFGAKSVLSILEEQDE